MSNYEQLLKNLNGFTRKYYLNRFLRGLILFTGLTLLVFLFFTLLEYNFYFSIPVRKVLFFAFIAIAGIAGYSWVLSPLLKYFSLGSKLSNEQAARIIGDHFPSVQDKLLNILQLKSQSDSQSANSLLIASIEQKTDEIKLVSFPAAIDLTNNKKHLRYALPPLLILIAFLVGAPRVIEEGSERILKNNQVFEKPAPFTFSIENSALEVVQFNDFTLNVTAEGEALPNEVFVRMGDFSYRMQKQGRKEFSYTFKKVQDDLDFTLYSKEVNGNNYTLKALLKPQLTSMSIDFDYPSYTGQKDETLSNSGDIVVPEGTMVRWNIETRNTESVSIRYSFEEGLLDFDQRGSNLFVTEKQILETGNYSLYSANKFLPAPDSVNYRISVVKDRFPTIQVKPFSDSSDAHLIYFSGESEDDYGIRSISYHYTIRNVEGQSIREGKEVLKNPGTRVARFDYLLNIDSFSLNAGDQLSYYFEVLDNDRINGSKSSRTSLMEFRKPSKDEYKEMAEENSNEIKEDLKDVLDESKKLQEEIKALREKVLAKKELNWEDKKEMEKLLKKQQELDKQLSKAQKKFNENRENQKEYSTPPEELQKKQEDLEKIFEESVDEEAEELMEKIQELMQELQREDALEMMEEFNFDQEEMEMNVDRLLELYKQLELEQMMTEQQQKLEELAEKQEELSEETKAQEENKDENSKSDSENEKEEKTQEDLEKEQENIKEEFEKIEEELDKIKEKNEELESPRKMDEMGDESEEVKDEMEKSQEQLKQNENKKASESQKKAAQKMKEMAQQMESSMMNAQMQQMEEDMATLRQLLENLINLSFDQEDLVATFSRTSAYTPKFVDLVQSQYKIKEDFKMVEDSLRALSKRVAQIESFIIDKVYDINKNVEKSLDKLEERQKTQAGDNQRKTMTYLNDLALMLSEVMDQMQQQMASMMPGSQMCDNPKPGAQGSPMNPMKGDGSQGGAPMKDISDGQGELNKEIERWKKAMKEGSGQGPGAKEFAQMAAEQSALRKMLRDIQKQLEEQGKASEDIQGILDNMNKTETELVNKQLSNETLKRQSEILTRLLEAEKADRERKWDNKREGQTAYEMERKLPPSLEEYIKERESEIKYYQTISPDLKPFYRRLVETYYKSIR